MLYQCSYPRGMDTAEYYFIPHYKPLDFGQVLTKHCPYFIE